MAQELAWLPDRLSDLGIPFKVLPGFADHGRPYTFEPKGGIWHHTASGISSTRATNEFIIRNGVRDVPGPISQLLCHREPIKNEPLLVLVGAGRANHAGKGWWPHGTNTGNKHGIGLEWVNNGVGELAHPAAVEASALLWSVIIDHYNWDLSRLWTHAGYAPGRKIDPAAPANHTNNHYQTWTMVQCRDLVRTYGFSNNPTTEDTVQAITPIRVLDTRNAKAPLGAGYHIIPFDGALPKGAKTAFLNVTVVRPNTNGYLSVVPVHAVSPLPPVTSTLPIKVWEQNANMAIVPSQVDSFALYLGPTETFGLTHVLVDLVGYSN